MGGWELGCGLSLSVVSRCVQVVKEKLNSSDLVFENLQWKEVVLYLRYHLTDEEINDGEFRVHSYKKI